MALASILYLISGNPAWATFDTYASEAAYQTAASPTVLEDFESYAEGIQISSLPALGIEFSTLDGGGFPVTYSFAGTPHGPIQLANFPNGVNAKLAEVCKSR